MRPVTESDAPAICAIYNPYVRDTVITFEHEPVSGADMAARIREYVEEGIDTFIFSGYPHKEESERFGRYVMPHFRGEAAVPVAPREFVAAGGQA